MSWFSHLMDSIEGFFANGKVRAFEATVVNLMPAALSIVTEINYKAPNRTLDQLNKIATDYALPTLQSLSTEPENVANTLLNLATKILQKNHAPDVAVYILNTVVQLAVSAVKSKSGV